MELINYCHIKGGNFGDDLNAHLWRRLFPDLAALSGRFLVYGVGTLLDGDHYKHIKKVVLGSGLGEARGAIAGPNWDFRWVRGPKTARQFGISKDLGLGDPGILWPGLQREHDNGGPVGIVPHYATWDSFDWTNVAGQAGMFAINPRQSPDAVIAAMRTCSRVMAESLHGAIFADAMGIPWASCVLAHRFNAFKWRDWLATIDRPYQPFMVDRSLVRHISRTKAWANRIARLVHYQLYTRHPHLRPVAPATSDDVRSVAGQLVAFGNQSQYFYCSRPERIATQRQSMLRSCAEFADDYMLHFSAESAVAW
jgi:succinoglycan biosynthesis protein ExoV